MKALPFVVGCMIVLGGCAETQLGDSSVATNSTLPPTKETKVAKVPSCAKPLATVALEERPIAVLANLGLTSPLPVLQAYVAESNCFQIVDANAAAIAARHGARHKPIVPDYVLTPDILSQSTNSGGANVGSFLPGVAGQVLQSVSVSTSEVATTLTLADTRSGLQVAHITGNARTTDVGASFATVSRRGGVSFGAYAETPIGRTASAALLDAYIKLVKHVESTPKPKAVASTKR